MGDYVKRCVSGYSGREARRNRDTARWRRYTPRVYSRCPPRPVHAPIEYTPPYLDACTDRSRVYRTTDVNFIHFALSLSLYLSFVVLFHPRYEELIHHVSSTCSSSCSRISKGIDFFFFWIRISFLWIEKIGWKLEERNNVSLLIRFAGVV